MSERIQIRLNGAKHLIRNILSVPKHDRIHVELVYELLPLPWRAKEGVGVQEYQSLVSAAESDGPVILSLESFSIPAGWKVQQKQYF